MSVDVRQVAERYARDAGLGSATGLPEVRKAGVPDRLVRDIADRFARQQHQPNEPQARSQYLRMAHEAQAQFLCMVEAGVRVRFFRGEGQPYETSEQLFAAMDAGEDLYIYPTENGHGPEGSEDPDNPLLLPAGIDIDGEPALHNDILRATHDYFGHYLVRAPFNLRGELRVGYSHLGIFSPEIHRAVLNEFVGQISWFYYGPHVRRPDGSVPRRGEADWIAPAERPFADQKINLMPAAWVDEFLAWGAGEPSVMA
ncbi:hypothetical protein ACFVWY_22385 [Streptomyces sp. NPDC058195]|uniref:hypothetical protein n=1 Tax=Streptomyces sp. NPDC058195 TaxID=3346375 RepID=UPI0036E03E52